MNMFRISDTIPYLVVYFPLTLIEYYFRNRLGKVVLEGIFLMEVIKNVDNLCKPLLSETPGGVSLCEF